MLRVGITTTQNDLKSRFLVVSTVVVGLFTAILLRIWFLQIFQGRKYTQFANENSIERVKVPAMRGRILDRNGKVIADSRASFDVVLTPQYVDHMEDVMGRLEKIFRWSDKEKDEILNKIDEANKNDSIVIERDMTRDELAQVLARKYSLPGVEVIHSPARSYPFGDHGSHLLGYLGEINKQEFQDLQKSTDPSNAVYELGDVWGILGVEKKYDKSLRGENGSRPTVQDAKGRQVSVNLSQDLLEGFKPVEPKGGQDLVLAMDYRVQEAAEEAFQGRSGGAIAIDPKTGDVLAILSRPEYSPEKFVRGVSSNYWATLVEDPLKPFYDRNLQGQYPPGSTFKFIMATAALSEKVTTPSETVFCPGHYRIGRELKSCWKTAGHGWVNMHEAIKQSCDVYFYEMGKRLGVDRIAQYAKQFGLGQPTGIGINREEKGLVPTEEWKQRIYGKPWVGGETLSVAIGQGYLQTTPVQMAIALAAEVNGGNVLQPRIALRTQNLDGTDQKEFSVGIRQKISIEPSIQSVVTGGLVSVVNDPNGTAYWTARSELVKIGGKTGTAQTVGKKSGIKREDHAWFIAYAPADDPKIVVAVIVEFGGHGGTTAAPIAKKMIEAYLGETS